MTLVANNLTLKLVEIAQEHSKLMVNLMALNSFTGVVPIQDANIQYSSPDIIDQRSKEVKIYATCTLFVNYSICFKRKCKNYFNIDY